MPGYYDSTSHYPRPVVIVNSRPSSNSILNPYWSTPEGQAEYQRWLDSPASSEAIRRNVAKAERFIVATNKPCRLTALEKLEEVTI